MAQLDAFQLLAVKFKRAEVAEAVRRQVQALESTKHSCSTLMKKLLDNNSVDRIIR